MVSKVNIGVFWGTIPKKQNFIKLIEQWDQQLETPPLWNLERPLFSRSLWVFALDLFVEKKMAKQFF